MTGRPPATPTTKEETSMNKLIRHALALGAIVLAAGSA
jgi:hypothetical protein